MTRRRWIVMAGIALFAGGCGLTAAQRKSYDDMNVAKREVAEKARALEERMLRYKAELENILRAVQEKRIPWEEAAPLIAKVTASYEEDKAAVLALRKTSEDLVQKIQAMKDLQVPWYYYILPAITGAIGLLGGHVKGIPNAKARAILGAVIRGVNAAPAPKIVKESIERCAVREGVEGGLHREVKRLT